MGGCAVSTLLGGLYCGARCDNVALADRIAFFPPGPTYRVGGAGEAGGAPEALTLLDGELATNAMVLTGSRHTTALRLRTRRGSSVAALHVRTPRPGGPRCTVLYAHGNAVDCGQMLGIAWLLCDTLAVDVLLIEYTGYGGSSPAAPSVLHLPADAEAGWEYLTQTRGVPPERILLFGQSIGSHAACHLAAAKADERPLGLVLHSPLMSALRVIGGDTTCAPSRMCCCLDLLRNDQLIRKVACPVYVIHGLADEEVAWTHGAGLAERTPRDMHYPPWFLPGVGHNNIVDTCPEEYIERLALFLSFCLKSRDEQDVNTHAPMTPERNQTSLRPSQQQQQQERPPPPPPPPPATDVYNPAAGSLQDTLPPEPPVAAPPKPPADSAAAAEIRPDHPDSY